MSAIALRIFYMSSLCSKTGINYIKNMHKIVKHMKTLIQIHKEGKYFVAIDLITNVADQGLTEDEAVSNLKRVLRSIIKFSWSWHLKGKALIP